MSPLQKSGGRFYELILAFFAYGNGLGCLEEHRISKRPRKAFSDPVSLNGYRCNVSNAFRVQRLTRDGCPEAVNEATTTKKYAYF